MLHGLGRRVVAAVAGALCAGLAACSSSTPSATGTPPPAQSSSSSSSSSPATSQGSGTPAATPTANPNVLDPFLYPENDTPLAQANAQLQKIWAPYQVTIIPGRHTLEAMPVVRTVANLTGGAIDDATAQSYLIAEYRDNAFSGWAEKNVQPDFLNNHLQGGIDSGSPELALLRQGRAINDPACDLYPVNPAVVKLDDATVNYLTKVSPGHFTLHGEYAIVQTYSGPCDVTLASPGPSATPLGSVPAGGATDLVAGHLTHDPVLGDLWFADGAFDCGQTQAPVPPKELCQAAAIG